MKEKILFYQLPARIGADLLRGLFIGITLVLPGMSGGTALLITGIYKKFLDDISSLNFKPYLVILIGAIAGTVFSVFSITSMLENYPHIIISVLLGMLLSSVYLVLSPLTVSKVKIVHLLYMLPGLGAALLLADEPLAHLPIEPTDSVTLIFSGGILTSATMLLPGISGSAILIMINLYDDLLLFVREWHFWRLALFSAGLATGLLLFARMVSYFYSRFFYPVSFLLTGLLIGSSRALIPPSFGWEIPFYVLGGGLAVILIGRRR